MKAMHAVEPARETNRLDRAVGSPASGESPSPAQIQEARKRARLTGDAAAALVHTSPRTWRKWEYGDRPMHPAFWELFLIKSSRREPPYPRPDEDA